MKTMRFPWLASALGAALWCLLLLGCDPVVSQRQIGSAETHTRVVNRPQPGFCMSCMPGFDGKMGCGFKFSSFCPHYVTEAYIGAWFERRHESGALDTVLLQLRGDQ